MLRVKRGNVKDNSESVFHYFVSAVKFTVTRVQNVIELEDHYVICSYSNLQKVGYVPLYAFRKYSDWAFEITLHSSSARRDSPCADSLDRDSGFT